MAQPLRATILRGTFGCPSGDHADFDPYEGSENWHESARGDGRSYGGVLDVVEQKPKESVEDFWTRANARVSELNDELRCSRCYD